MIRVRAADQHDRIGSLVLNPGGQGLSGLDYMPLWASWLPDALLARFDVVTFDPRGTGRSAPIRCLVLPADQATAATPSLLTASGFATAMTLLQAQAQSCVDALALALADRTAAFSTDATARDLDLLRAALGEDVVTFVGWSYGARLGAHYAHLFPARVRALVLDGPQDPQAMRGSVVESQIAGFEAAFLAYADRCSQRKSCVSFGDPRALFDRVVRTARSTPIPSGRPVGDPAANAETVLRFLASPEAWPFLALSEADDGDSGSHYDMIDSLEGKRSERREVDVDDAAFVIGCNDSASGAPAGSCGLRRRGWPSPTRASASTARGGSSAAPFGQCRIQSSPSPTPSRRHRYS